MRLVLPSLRCSITSLLGKIPAAQMRGCLHAAPTHIRETVGQVIKRLEEKDRHTVSAHEIGVHGAEPEKRLTR
jgi:hypothetical protein